MSVVLACGIVTGAQASSVLEEVKAFVNKEIKFELNGQPWYPKDEIITYDDSTYLPVRAVAEALNIAVDYEHDTRIVYLGEKAEGVPLFSVDKSLSYHGQETKDPSKTTYFGTEYESVIDVTRLVGGVLPKATITFKLNKNYQKLVLHVATTTDEAQIQILNGTVELLDSNLYSEDQVKELIVDVAGIDTLSIDIRSEHKDGAVAILSTSHLK